MVTKLSTHGAVMDDTPATRKLLSETNDNLTRYFHGRIQQAVAGEAILSDKEIQAAMTLLRQNRIEAPADSEESITDRARAAGKLQFGALDEKRKVVPFRRPAPPAGQSQVEPPEDAA